MSNWDLSKIYKTETEYEEAKEVVLESIKEINELKTNAKDHLLALLKTMEHGEMKLSTLYCYTHMLRDEDSRKPESQKKALEIEEMVGKFESAISFAQPLILSLTKEELDKFYENEEAKHFKKNIDKILRFKNYTLSEKEEYILSKTNDMGRAGQNISYNLMFADMKFPEMETTDKKLTHASYMQMLLDQNREVRKEAFEKMFGTFGSLGNTYAQTYYSNVKAITTQAEIRGYDSPRQMELYADAVSEEVYDALIKSVENGLPALYKYYGLRKKFIDVDEQHIYDTYLPLAEGDSISFTFEEAQKVILEALKPLGEEYVQNIKRAFDENWIDAYPREGKKAGAYSWGTFETSPYILMNYDNSLNALFTLVHELGHSMHSYFSRKNNPFLYSSYTIFVAEVASTFNELMLLDYLMKNAKDEKEELSYLEHYIESFRSTVYRQTMFAEFEKIAHNMAQEGKPLTLSDLSEVHLNLVKKYFGDNVVIDDIVQYEWARIPHFYNDFYVYKYATGFSAASVLSERVLNKEEGALEAYLNFLKDGGNNYPLDQLRNAGADMENPESIDIGLRKFAKLVDQLETLAK